ncbi:TonB-dependent receptor [Niabella terrae]
MKRRNFRYFKTSWVLDKLKLTAQIFITAFLVLWGLPAQSQTTTTATGKVINDRNEPVPGASINQEGTSIYTTSNEQGRFSIQVTEARANIIITSIGYNTKIVSLADGHMDLTIQMDQNQQSMDNVIVVGYGKQKRESVVAAITQTTGKVLERAGGVSSVGMALTGNVPGLITSQGSGLPGDEDPQIIIRTRSSWNNSDPLILVDGVERPMKSVEIGSVETISVLKDASATAVFGSRGANGVILITTKRGSSGKATIRGMINSVVKVPSKLPGKYDSYDALRTRNEVIEYELSKSPSSWNDYLPEEILRKYRFPASLEEAERYPNVDWTEAMFKDYTSSQNANLNISGGTRFVKYFAGADFLREGDIFKVYENNSGYVPGFGFNRLNVRSNLDFQLTKYTLFKVNLSGSYGVRKSPWVFSGGDYPYWVDAYSAAPDVFLPVYSDGAWGYYAPNEGRAENSPRSLSTSGIQYRTTARMTTDFTLDQDLSLVLKGLKFLGTVSFDNTFDEVQRGVNNLYRNGVQRKWISPETGAVYYKEGNDGITGFDFQQGINWSPAGGNVEGAFRRLFYNLQLNYTTTIAQKHNVSVMGLVNRNQSALGSMIPSYREDWVFRTTYGYDGRYNIEYNGAYNGSEQFSKENRFAFFSSGGVNWVLSREKFMRPLKFLNVFKLRASYGETGFDGGSRFLYLTQWAYGGKARLGTTGEGAEQSPYNWYRESFVGNPNIQWEEAVKVNIGADFEIFDGLVSGKFDFFRDKRSKILLSGDGRAVPSYFGMTPPTANLGKVDAKGYEIELHIKKMLGDVNIWADLNMTHAVNIIKERDDAALLPDYQKMVGKEIGQTYTWVSAGYYNTWDQLYGSATHQQQDEYKLPGNYYLVDFNGDGVIDNLDNIPYGYSTWPQNTYNATIGIDWKGFSAFLQFYGANNVTRWTPFGSLGKQNHVVYEEGAYWNKENQGENAIPAPRWLSTPYGEYKGNLYQNDGSFARLKNAELSYRFDNGFGLIKRLGLQSLRIYLNGNNLLVWTKMPDDRESNFGGSGVPTQGAYPTFRRFNLGANITF